MSSGVYTVAKRQIPGVVFKDDPVINFEDNHLSASHPKWETAKTRYDLLRSQLELTSQVVAPGQAILSDSQVQDRNAALASAIHTYASSHASPNTLVDGNPHATWKDVLAEVSLTQERYASKGNPEKGILQSMRGKLRSFDGFADRFEPWLQLLPSDSWQGSLICGGLKVVLQASGHAGSA